jgi:hypothetical protein
MVDLTTFPKVIEGIGIEELKALAISAGFPENKVNKNQTKLNEYISDILSRKSLFNKCRKDGYVYNKKSKKCIFLEGTVDLKVKKQNLNQETDGKIVKTEGKGNVYIISFPGKEGQRFLLVPNKTKKDYHGSLAPIIGGEARPESIQEDVFNKVKGAYEKDAFCVSVLGTEPEEVTSKDVINSLALEVSFKPGKKDEYGLGSDDAILYTRDLNVFFLIETNSPDTKAIQAFIKLGGKLGDRTCNKGKKVCEEKEFCMLKNKDEGSCVQEQFEEKGLEEESVGGTIFRGPPEVMKEFRSILGVQKGATPPVVGEIPIMKEEPIEEPIEDVDRLKAAIRTCLESGTVSVHSS